MRDAFLAEMQGLKDKVDSDPASLSEDKFGLDSAGWKWGRGKAKWAKE
jgi:hypothetical protein